MVDIIVLLFLFVSAIYGYCKGLLRMVITIAASIITILVSIILLPYINNVVEENTDIYPKVEASLEVQLESYTTEYLENMEDSQQGNFIESLNLPKAIRNMILKNNTTEYYEEQGIETFAQYMSKVMAGVVIRAAIFLITYIALFLLIRVVSAAVKIVDYIPFIKSANRLSGMLLCVLESLFVIWLICLAATACSTNPIGQSLNGLIQESKVLQILYQYNPFVLFF